VALCKLWYPPSPGSGPSYWTRNRIFDTIAAAMEWRRESWRAFHGWVQKWVAAATLARNTKSRVQAIETWQLLLGDQFFPATVSP
jgi:hypothetical protein